MKRKSLILVIFIITTMCLLVGCNNEDLKTERSELQTEINELQTDVDRLQEVRDGLIQKDEIIYVIELEISQSHFSLDLEEHMKDATVILVSHRITTLMSANKIMVLHQGEIEEMGTHNELIHQDGIYRKIYDIQMNTQLDADSV